MNKIAIILAVIASVFQDSMVESFNPNYSLLKSTNEQLSKLKLILSMIRNELYERQPLPDMKSKWATENYNRFNPQLENGVAPNPWRLNEGLMPKDQPNVETRPAKIGLNKKGQNVVEKFGYGQGEILKKRTKLETSLTFSKDKVESLTPSGDTKGMKYGKNMKQVPSVPDLNIVKRHTGGFYKPWSKDPQSDYIYPRSNFEVEGASNVDAAWKNVDTAQNSDKKIDAAWKTQSNLTSSSDDSNVDPVTENPVENEDFTQTNASEITKGETTTEDV